MHLLYKLVFHDDTYYIGVTSNLKRRLYEHKNNPNTTNWSKVEILQDNLEENKAYSLEEILVPDHAYRDIKCRNRTKGGRHPFNMRQGVVHSEATKEKISLSKKGIKPNISAEEKALRSNRLKGEYNPSKRIEVRAKLSKATLLNSKRRNKPGTMLGKNLSMSAIEKISYKINTPNGIFLSSSKAALHFSVSQQTIINRCKSENFPEWWIISVGCKYNTD